LRRIARGSPAETDPKRPHTGKFRYVTYNHKNQSRPTPNTLSKIVDPESTLKA